MRTLYVATTNTGKLRDFGAAIETHRVTLEPLPGIDTIPAPIEDAPSFTGNACLKAIAYSQHLPHEIILADDSGLEVDALNGAPGIYSARYAARANFVNLQSHSQDELNNAYLLHQLATVPIDTRTARYRCVLAAAIDGKVVATGQGSVEGTLLTEPRGSDGFGYDPLFLLPSLDLTMAEIDVATKLSMSHRGRALADLMKNLAAYC